MRSIAKRQGLSYLWDFGIAVVLVGLLSYPGHALYKETPPEQPLAPRAIHAVSLQAPHTAFQGRSAEIVIRVQDEQGEALDGVPVVFEVDPTWDGDAAVFPQSTMTNRGIARVQFQADSIGVVNVTARVGQVTRTVPIVITMLHNTGQGW